MKRNNTRAGRRLALAGLGLGIWLALTGCQGQAPQVTPSAAPVAQPSAGGSTHAAGMQGAAAAEAGQATPAATRTAGTQGAATPPAMAQVTGLAMEASSPTAAPTAAATATGLPTAAATATATATPAPAPRRLTDGGCCWDPFFLDGQVAFIDRPGADAPVGFYAVPLTGGPAKLVESRLGYFLNGGAYFSYQDKGQTVIERRQAKQQWRLNTQGQPVTVSPDGTEAAWSLHDWNGPYDQRRTQLWRAPLQGGKPAAVLTLYGGGLSAWLPGNRWLLTGRRAISETDRTLFVYDLKTGQRRDLFHAQGFRSLSVAPGGAWVLLQVALDPQAERDGTWLIPTDGGEPRKLDWFGAFGWRDATHVYYMPFRAAAPAQEVWLYDVIGNSSRRLIDPAVTPFKIAQGDFVFAPDGKSLVYVSAADLNLWVLDLGS